MTYSVDTINLLLYLVDQTLEIPGDHSRYTFYSSSTIFNYQDQNIPVTANLYHHILLTTYHNNHEVSLHLRYPCRHGFRFAFAGQR